MQGDYFRVHGYDESQCHVTSFDTENETYPQPRLSVTELTLNILPIKRKGHFKSYSSSIQANMKFLHQLCHINIEDDFKAI